MTKNTSASSKKRKLLPENATEVKNIVVKIVKQKAASLLLYNHYLKNNKEPFTSCNVNGFMHSKFTDRGKLSMLQTALKKPTDLFFLPIARNRFGFKNIPDPVANLPIAEVLAIIDLDCADDAINQGGGE